MRILNKDEKEIYKGLLKDIEFKTIDCWDVTVPDGWKNIKVAKFE